MTRYTATTKNGRKRLNLNATTTRDESEGYRHKWTTTVRLGLLSGSGPNLKTALANLEDELLALANSEAATAALAAERMKAMPPPPPKPAPEPEPFEHDADVEVRVGGEEPRWVAGLYDHRDGARFRVWVPEFGGFLTVERSYIRAVNRPSLADVG